MDSIRFNLFRFAPSELSHSAFWAWVLQSLDNESPSTQAGVRSAAMRLLGRMGVPSITSPVDVRTEVKLPGGKDRLDILLTEGSGLSLVIENKISAKMSTEQLERYRARLETLEGRYRLAWIPTGAVVLTYFSPAAARIQRSSAEDVS